MADATVTAPAPTSDSAYSAGSSSSAGPLRVVGTVAGAFLGAVLLVAVWAKAIAPAAFVEEIANRGLGLVIGPVAVAYVALALEAGLGVWLLTGVRRLWVLVPGALLVAFFLFLTGQDYARDLMGLEPVAASCGCFGNLVVRTPAQAFWQDLALLLPPLLLAFLGRPANGVRVPKVRTVLGIVAAVGVMLLAWKAPDLPLDDLATRLKPGVRVADLCAGEGEGRVCLDTVVPELDQGSHLVVLDELNEELGAQVATMNAYMDYRHAGGDGPDLWLVTTAEHAERQAFFWQWAPAFEMLQAPELLLTPLYRTLPRSFAVVDGEVTDTWSGLPPFERWQDGP